MVIREQGGGMLQEPSHDRVRARDPGVDPCLQSVLHRPHLVFNALDSALGGAIRLAFPRRTFLRDSGSGGSGRRFVRLLRFVGRIDAQVLNVVIADACVKRSLSQQCANGWLTI